MTIVQLRFKLGKELELINMSDNLGKINAFVDFDLETAGFRFYFVYFTDRGDQLF